MNFELGTTACIALSALPVLPASLRVCVCLCVCACVTHPGSKLPEGVREQFRHYFDEKVARRYMTMVLLMLLLVMMTMTRVRTMMVRKMQAFIQVLMMPCVVCTDVLPTMKDSSLASAHECSLV